MNKKERYLLISSDWELLEKAKIKIVKAWNKKLKNCNLHSFFWEESPAGEKKLREKIQTQDFFAEKILIIDINKWHIYGINKQKEFLAKLLKNDRYLILTSQKKMKKELEIMLLENNFHIKQISKFTQIQKRKIIMEKLQEAKINFDDLTFNYLLTNLSSKFLTLEKDLEKIIFFFWKKTPKQLNLSLAKKIINSHLETNIFALIDALLNNNQKEFWQKYKQINPPIPLIYLLVTFNTYLYQMKKMQILMKKKLSFTEIVTKMAKSPFLINNLLKIAKNTDNFFIDKLIKKSQEIEYLSKTLNLKEETLLTNFFMI